MEEEEGKSVAGEAGARPFGNLDAKRRQRCTNLQTSVNCDRARSGRTFGSAGSRSSEAASAEEEEAKVDVDVRLPPFGVELPPRSVQHLGGQLARLCLLLRVCRRLLRGVGSALCLQGAAEWAGRFRVPGGAAHDHGLRAEVRLRV